MALKRPMPIAQPMPVVRTAVAVERRPDGVQTFRCCFRDDAEQQRRPEGDVQPADDESECDGQCHGAADECAENSRRCVCAHRRAAARRTGRSRLSRRDLPRNPPVMPWLALNPAAFNRRGVQPRMKQSPPSCKRTPSRPAASRASSVSFNCAATGIGAQSRAMLCEPTGSRATPATCARPAATSPERTSCRRSQRPSATRSEGSHRRWRQSCR